MKLDKKYELTSADIEIALQACSLGHIPILKEILRKLPTSQIEGEVGQHVLNKCMRYAVYGSKVEVVNFLVTIYTPSAWLLTDLIIYEVRHYPERVEVYDFLRKLRSEYHTLGHKRY